GMITVNLRRRHADRFRRGRLAREPVSVETSQICPPRVRDAIIGARAAFERADARAPADLAFATEAAQVMGSLTESTELALARLAEELVVLRHARELPAAERERRALEARAIYAPLANRLGVWQLKWELEDLAFRYLEPEEYKRVAAALNERRADRERYIETLCAELRAGLAAAGIAAEVYGRPKHIYSIYRKMQRKQLAFEQLFDVRAVRLVAASS